MAVGGQRANYAYFQHEQNLFKIMTRIVSALCATFLVIMLAGGALEAHAQHQGGHAEQLSEPGNPIFGAVQEVIQRVEEDDSVDWADVDLEQLRQHLIDMHRAATEVEVVYRYAIDDGILIRVAPTSEEAHSSLGRMLQMHPEQLEQETGWTMEGEPTQDGYELRVTTEDPAEIEKVRALGYIGLLAYGAHHQHHHWMIATGQTP